MQGKQPTQIVKPEARRPKPLPREGSKMAVDFYMASMLNEQVKMLLQREDGIDLSRMPTPYREILTFSPTPEDLVRHGPGEDELEDDEENTVGTLEYLMGGIEQICSYLFYHERLFSYVRHAFGAILSFGRQPAQRDVEMGVVREGTPGAHTFVLEDLTPDTPGSQATPKAEGGQDESSYFPYFKPQP